MSTIVAGLASSHAFTFRPPDTWEDVRASNRAGYARRFGVEPPVQPQIAAESYEQIRPRFARITAGLERVRDQLQTQRPDALLIIGDDQNENFTEENVPQLGIFTGDRVQTAAYGLPGPEHRCHAELAEALLAGCVRQGFDLSYMRRFPHDQLKAHAFGPALAVLDPQQQIPIVPLFVNAIHPPAPEPARCYAFGQAIRRVLDERPAGERVAVYASGGLSHFTAGYPWQQYTGPFGYGAISPELDTPFVAWLRAGQGANSARLTSADLLAHGDVELRGWIVLLGILGDVPATEVIYEPFYRAIMAMGVAYWDPAAAQTG